MALFEEYKNNPDPILRERANNWAIAIGLQRVDGLNVSEFLIQVARQEIGGRITMNEAQAIIDGHYAQMNSNRSSYEIVPPDSEESKRIADSTKPNARSYMNESLFLIVNSPTTRWSFNSIILHQPGGVSQISILHQFGAFLNSRINRKRFCSINTTCSMVLNMS